MRSCYLAVVAGAILINAVPAAGQADQVKRGGYSEEQQPGILLRFQLIAATDSTRVDPAITAIDAVLKDLFRFPGYRLLSQAAVMMQRPATVKNSASGSTMATQLLSGDGDTYKLSIFIDSTTAQTVRMNVSLATVPKTAPVPGSSNTLFSTSVEVSYGHTVVLGSTQPAVVARGAGAQTLILAVRAESRQAPAIDAAAPGASPPAFTDAKVDEPVLVRTCATPGYPPELRAAGISGSVQLRYVVGTDGKAEPASIIVVNSTNKAFEPYAINAIRSCSYAPAKIKGTAVRDLIEHTVRFVPPK